MVIPFPAAHAAPQPIGVLLNRCIGFLEGFEDDSEQCVAPLLQQLRITQATDPILLPAPAAVKVDVRDHTTFVSVGSSWEGGFYFNRLHDSAHWFWQAFRLDDTGRPWHCAGYAVVDDFGNLVEVPA